MHGFSDSGLFKLGEDGRVCHRRDGDTWADKVLDGVDLDKTIMWDNEGYAYIEEDEGIEMVGERKITNEVLETCKEWKNQKGEGKFTREKKIPQKKKKKYPTKPKPKNPWNKRLSKVAQVLDMGDTGSHTEQKANEEWNDFWDEKSKQQEKEEQQKYDYNTHLWEDWVKSNPGEFAVISLKYPVNDMGFSIFDIDDGGVNRSTRLPWHTDKELEDVPNKYDSKEMLFFTYWDSEREEYFWRPLKENTLSLNRDGYQRFWDTRWLKEVFKEYYPKLEWMKKTFRLEDQMSCRRNGFYKDKYDDPFSYQIDGISTWQNGIDWEIVWRVMDILRTGKNRKYSYDEGDEFEHRSFMSYSAFQIPKISYY